MTLKAAQQSRLNFEQIASAAPGAAEGTALTGSSPEETLAMLSVLAGKFKSGDTAADRIKAFSSKVGISKDKRLKGKSVLEALRTVQNDFSAKDRGEFLGEGVEINTAFRYLMENDSLITSRQAEIAAAGRATGAASPLNQAVEARLSDPTERAKHMADRARIAAEVAQEGNLGQYGFDIARGKSQARKQLHERGANMFARTAADMAMGIGGAFTSDPDKVYAFGASAAQMVDPKMALQSDEMFNEHIGDMRALGKEAKQAAASIRELNNATSPPRTNAQRAELNRQREN
jgi:hypothetical protein